MSAVFTLLYDRDYLPGALLLGSLLKDLAQKSNSAVKLGILIDKSVFDQVQLSYLDKIYDDLVDVPVLKSTLHHKLHHDLKRPELDKTFTKIYLWSLHQKYEKILYLDSDTLPNLDSNGSVLDLLKLDFPANKILAAPDSGFPDIFNSGVFVLRPNPDDFGKLLELVNSDGEVSFDGADQGLLNQYFNSKPDWVNESVVLGQYDVSALARPSNWIPVPFLYNVTPSAQYEYTPAYNYFSSAPIYPFGVPRAVGDQAAAQGSAPAATQAYSYTASQYYGDQVKLIHFIGPHKPWTLRGVGGVHGRWWNLWNQYFHGIDVKDIAQSNNKLTYSTADSLWDPAKSSPPRSPAPSAAAPRPKYSNRWDQPRPKERKPVKKNKQDLVREREKESKFGYHWNQKPERSFEGVEDYIPSLPVISKLKQKEQEPDSTTDNYSTAVSFDKVSQKLEQLNIEK